MTDSLKELYFRWHCMSQLSVNVWNIETAFLAVRSMRSELMLEICKRKRKKTFENINNK